MGKVASAASNPAIEFFFALLQKRVLNRGRWDTCEQLVLAILTRIECDYRRHRPQAAPGRLSPIEFETIHNSATAA